MKWQRRGQHREVVLFEEERERDRSEQRQVTRLDVVGDLPEEGGDPPGVLPDGPSGFAGLRFGVGRHGSSREGALLSRPAVP